MKKQVEIIILLLFGLAFLVYLFPFVFVEAAKLQSGVTIKAPSTTVETEKICNDMIDNDNDGKIDAIDEDCAAAPAGPTAGTCELQIVSGVPINYGQLTVSQDSSEQKYSTERIVTIKNVGTSYENNIMIKGGDWINDATGAKMSGPELTRVTFYPRTPEELPGDETLKAKLSSDVPRNLGPISPGQTKPIYFHFGPEVNAPNGSYHQEVTIDLVC